MRIAGLLILLSLAACVNGNRRLDALPYVPDRVDGSYQGVLTLTSYPHTPKDRWWLPPQVDPAVCPHTTNGVVEVGDHVLTYAYAPNLIFNVPLKSDGSFAQTVGAATLRGQIRHGRMRFYVLTPVCTSRFAGHFKLNHS